MSRRPDSPGFAGLAAKGLGPAQPMDYSLPVVQPSRLHLGWFCGSGRRRPGPADGPSWCGLGAPTPRRSRFNSACGERRRARLAELSVGEADERARGRQHKARMLVCVPSPLTPSTASGEGLPAVKLTCVCVCRRAEPIHPLFPVRVNSQQKSKPSHSPHHPHRPRGCRLAALSPAPRRGPRGRAA